MQSQTPESPTTALVTHSVHEITAVHFVHNKGHDKQDPFSPNSFS